VSDKLSIHKRVLLALVINLNKRIGTGIAAMDRQEESIRDGRYA
jgi:hypothetical protein